jgi:hypothetical protein
MLRRWETNGLILLNFNSEAESRRMPLDKGKALLNLLTNTFTQAQFGLIGGPKDAVFIEQLLVNASNHDRIKTYCRQNNLVNIGQLNGKRKGFVDN